LNVSSESPARDILSDRLTYVGSTKRFTAICEGVLDLESCSLGLTLHHGHPRLRVLGPLRVFLGGGGRLITLELQCARSRHPGARTEGPAPIPRLGGVPCQR
jgi:hypothetical protein